MNFAAPAVLILLLLLPGAIFRYTYHRDVSEGEVIDPRPFSAETILYVLIAGVFHLVWCTSAYALNVVTNGHWLKVDYAAVFALLFGNHAQGFGPDLARALAHPGWIAGYFLSIYLLAWVAGACAQRLVIGLELDRRIGGVLRFKSPWLYAFGRGKESIKQHPLRRAGKANEGDEPFDAVVIAATIEMADRAWLYSGILVDYRVDRSGNLTNLTLAAASRRLLEDEAAPFIDIEGDRLIIDYARVATLNVHHVWFEGYEEVTIAASDLAEELAASSQTSPASGGPAASISAHSASL